MVDARMVSTGHDVTFDKVKELSVTQNKTACEHLDSLTMRVDALACEATNAAEETRIAIDGVEQTAASALNDAVTSMQLLRQHTDCRTDALSAEWYKWLESYKTNAEQRCLEVERGLSALRKQHTSHNKKQIAETGVLRTRLETMQARIADVEANSRYVTGIRSSITRLEEQLHVRSLEWVGELEALKCRVEHFQPFQAVLNGSVVSQEGSMTSQAKSVLARGRLTNVEVDQSDVKMSTEIMNSMSTDAVLQSNVGIIQARLSQLEGHILPLDQETGCRDQCPSKGSCDSVPTPLFARVIDLEESQELLKECLGQAERRILTVEKLALQLPIPTHLNGVLGDLSALCEVDPRQQQFGAQASLQHHAASQLQPNSLRNPLEDPCSSKQESFADAGGQQPIVRRHGELSTPRPRDPSGSRSSCAVEGGNSLTSDSEAEDSLITNTSQVTNPLHIQPTVSGKSEPQNVVVVDRKPQNAGSAAGTNAGVLQIQEITTLGNDDEKGSDVGHLELSMCGSDFCRSLESPSACPSSSHCNGTGVLFGEDSACSTARSDVCFGNDAHEDGEDKDTDIEQAISLFSRPLVEVQPTKSGDGGCDLHTNVLQKPKKSKKAVSALSPSAEIVGLVTSVGIGGANIGRVNSRSGDVADMKKESSHSAGANSISQCDGACTEAVNMVISANLGNLTTGLSATSVLDNDSEAEGRSWDDSFDSQTIKPKQGEPLATMCL